MTAGYSGTPLIKKLGIKGGESHRFASCARRRYLRTAWASCRRMSTIDTEVERGTHTTFVQAFFIWRADYEAEFADPEIRHPQERHDLDILVQKGRQDAHRYH